MDWTSGIKGFKTYLRLEKSLSTNSIEAYIRDIEKFTQFIDYRELSLSPKDVSLNHLREFISWITNLEISATSQARIISGIRAFYQFLLLEDEISNDPTQLLDTPKTRRKLPETLSIEEINKIVSVIDLSKPEGDRNKAIIETMYSCGLRVSELVNLKLSDIFEADGFVRIIGKGDKERIVPIGSIALKFIEIYKHTTRNHCIVKKGNEDCLFLNRRGAKLTRVMVFTIVKNLVKITGINKKISPHTFRHSFATHLIEGGADLRAIQEMLGHESITTTEIYTHLDRDYLRQTIIDFHPRS